MRKFKHFETESGKTIKNAQFDGYSINDRPFEGLMFQVEIQEDGSLKVYVKPSDEDYFSDFNQEKWLKIATDYAYENDIFEDPISGEDCWLVDTDNKSLDETKEVKKTPIQIGVSSTIDKLNQIFGKKENSDKSEKVDIIETKEPVIGKYKTNRRFISFLSAYIQGARVRLLRESAYIDGNQLSGVLDGAKFKITICDEGTINFEVVENNSLTPNIDDSMIQRLIASIDEMRVNGYAQKFVVSDLEFKDEDGSRCYLEVEHQKPIDRFASILDSFKEEKSADTTLSDKGFSILDALFSSESDEEVEREFEGESEGESEQIILSERDAEVFFDDIENPREPNDNLKSAASSYMEEQFLKMNESKINELKKRIENTEKEVERIRGEIYMSEKKLKNQVEDLKVLETRLDSFNKNDDLNGYVFYVSEEQKAEDIGLAEDNRAIADKIADILSLKKDVLFKMLTEGHYKIRIAEKSDMAAEKVKITDGILEKIKSLVNGDESLEAKVTMVEPGHFEYRGSLNWHQVVGKMIRKGFEQEPEFDKLCQSNSYDSHERKDEIENIIN
jgi:hypothetical protein